MYAHLDTPFLHAACIPPCSCCPSTLAAAANKLEEVYGQIFKVLKPGGLFLSYEWVSTKQYDPANPEHVRVIDEINFGNGLPEMRTYTQAEDAGKAVGFKLVTRLVCAGTLLLCRVLVLCVFLVI